MPQKLTGFSLFFRFWFFGQRLSFFFAAELKLSLKFASSLKITSLISLLNELFFFSFTYFLILKIWYFIFFGLKYPNIFFCLTLVEINLLAFAKDLPFSATPRRLYRDRVTTALSLRCKLNRSGVALKVAKVWEQH